MYAGNPCLAVPILARSQVDGWPLSEAPWLVVTLVLVVVDAAFIALLFQFDDYRVRNPVPTAAMVGSAHVLMGASQRERQKGRTADGDGAHLGDCKTEHRDSMGQGTPGLASMIVAYSGQPMLHGKFRGSSWMATMNDAIEGRGKQTGMVFQAPAASKMHSTQVDQGKKRKEKKKEACQKTWKLSSSFFFAFCVHSLSGTLITDRPERILNPGRRCRSLLESSLLYNSLFLHLFSATCRQGNPMKQFILWYQKLC